MKEVVTIQCGHYANYVGTHFWNMQDDVVSFYAKHEGLADPTVDSNILYRSGETASVRFPKPGNAHSCLLHLPNPIALATLSTPSLSTSAGPPNIYASASAV
jgi:hypothetical protein